MKMYYTVYKTTNLINGKFYVGIHETLYPYDNYHGSGLFLKKAFKKYGISNFKKEVLYVFDNKDDMVNKEKEIVNEEFVRRKETYNMALGGFGLNTLTKEKRIETIEKIRNSNKNRDSTISSKQRKDTLLAKDSNIFKIMGVKSGNTQKERYKNGYKNPRQRLDLVQIYNNEDVVVYETLRIDLESLCKKEGLPCRVLIKSLTSKGSPLYEKQLPRNESWLKFKGWYATYTNQTTLKK